MSKEEGNFPRKRLGLAARGCLRAFTLLEVMVAVAIIGLIAVGIFRFVDSTLRVVQAMSQNGDGSEEMEALCRILQFQINDLPDPNIEPGGILGQPHVFGGNSLDEMQWRSSAGSGLFTAFATGDYEVTLRVQNEPSKGSTAQTSALGVRRVPVKTLNANEFNWVPILPGITGLEVRYFDPRSNNWQPKWTDRIARPSLIQLKIWRENGGEPFEMILRVPPLGPPIGNPRLQ